MRLLKKMRFFLLVGLIIFGFVIHVALREKSPDVPTKVYKTGTPVSKPRLLQTDMTLTHRPIPHDHTHDSLQDLGHHDHATEETGNRNTYDWRDDTMFDVSQQKGDPWKKGENRDAGTPEHEAAGIYPPPNWHKTEDPILRAEYYRAQMIKQFGDTPVVQTVSDWELKQAMRSPVTHDEYIHYLEALYHLFPREETLETLNYHRELRAKGVKVKMVPEGDLR